MAQQYTFATAYTQDGEVFDRLGNIDVAIAYANEGYRVEIHEDGHAYTKEQMQEAVDAELAMAIDCFGSERRR